jgi:hypothetical protein
MFPDGIARKHPELQPDPSVTEKEAQRRTRKLLFEKAATLGLGSESVRYVEINDMADSQRLLDELAELSEARLVVVSVNFINLLIQNQPTSPLLREIAADESALRRLTVSWFQYSTIFSALKELSRAGRTITLTTTNGCVLSTRATALCGVPVTDTMVRFYSGPNISSDERHALVIEEPERFKLPAPTPETAFVVLKENYYFTPCTPEGGGKHSRQARFQQGGISMEELILPIVLLQPRQG